METTSVDVKTLDIKTLKSLVYDGLKGIENMHGVIKKIQADLAILNAEIIEKEMQAMKDMAEHQRQTKLELVPACEGTPEQALNGCAEGQCPSPAA